MTGLGVVGLFLFFRARSYDVADALLIAALGGSASGLLAASYYWNAKFLWHDFGPGIARSRARRTAEVLVDLFVVGAAITCLVVIVRQQGKA